MHHTADVCCFAKMFASGCDTLRGLDDGLAWDLSLVPELAICNQPRACAWRSNRKTPKSSQANLPLPWATPSAKIARSVQSA